MELSFNLTFSGCQYFANFKVLRIVAMKCGVKECRELRVSRENHPQGVKEDRL